MAKRSTLVKFLLFVICLFFQGLLYAQIPNKLPQTNKNVPLPAREVSGIVMDKGESPIPSVSVYIKSDKDSIITQTNADGIFLFKNIKSATFVITIASIGYQRIVKKMKLNDVLPRLVLDPFVINDEVNTLNEVTIKGEKGIVYKVDTVEYTASDYKVRENATVDELLKKMEGMEVGTDGSVTHQGQDVVKARLNGKDYLGGSIAQVIQNLPADIVDKIQIVDDYGDQAARTGIKDGDPQKVLNITTKADRSVGNLVRASAGVGSSERYEGKLFLQRINANQQLGATFNLRNTVNGVASTGNIGSGGGQGGGNNGGGRTQAGGGQGGGGGSGGTSQFINPAFSYRDQITKKIEINTSYNFSNNNTNSINISEGQQFSTLGTTNFVNQSERDNISKSHKFDFELEYKIDAKNFLRINPSVNIATTEAISSSNQQRTGLIHQGVVGSTNSTNKTPSYSGLIFYQHIFDKPKRNISFQLNLSGGNQEQDNEQNNRILYYQAQSDVVLKDSLVHRFIERNNLNRVYRGSMTYVEPITTKTQLELNAQVNYRSYDNAATTSRILADGTSNLVDSLSNIFAYSFTESRVALNYRYTGTKTNISVGLTGIPTVLEGTKQNLNTSIKRTNFNLIPIFRFQYAWSRTQRFSINYGGNASEPSFNQIQPVRDESNPQNPVVGNPDLRPAFRHTLNSQYNNYLSNQRLNLSFGVNYTKTMNQIATNVVQIPDALGTFKNETRFMNLNGAYNVNGNYNISKQLDNRKYNLALNGSVGYSHQVSMSNNTLNGSNVWRLNQRFGPRISPNDNIEINPYVGYDITRSSFQLAKGSDIRTLSLSIDGKFYFLKTFSVNYNASKSFIQGLSANITRNPFIINGAIEKEFFKRKNAVLSIQIYDILKQNNFVNQTLTEYSITNTLSNALSRYFMVNFRVNLQKWSGRPTRNGRQMQRRGDGSFEY
ncbi:outer membrane beta-barrel family protein [Pedobacter mucosus]|uniref:outer membrane beta-barrel family protein n=1 Tax=Pedobacter mucosus TaxID=2895286 RepID=UPI001EE43D05|nr:outer membrane beta-barrel family protein [Pedobacter mucosus]UKT64566.1 outer membrane beta-barrel protein [Pedobacter mucosus]